MQGLLRLNCAHDLKRGSERLRSNVTVRMFVGLELHRVFGGFVTSNTALTRDRPQGEKPGTGAAAVSVGYADSSLNTGPSTAAMALPAKAPDFELIPDTS